jgi:hypothetical protein
MPPHKVAAGTIITRLLDVKGGGRGIQLIMLVFSVEFRRLKNIIPAEPIELTVQSSRKNSEIEATL